MQPGIGQAQKLLSCDSVQRAKLVMAIRGLGFEAEVLRYSNMQYFTCMPHEVGEKSKASKSCVIMFDQEISYWYQRFKKIQLRDLQERFKKIMQPSPKTNKLTKTGFKKHFKNKNLFYQKPKLLCLLSPLSSQAPWPSTPLRPPQTSPTRLGAKPSAAPRSARRRRRGRLGRRLGLAEKGSKTWENLEKTRI